MSSAEHIRSVYENYPRLFTNGDIDSIVDMYAENATIEDPIGSELYEGKEGVRKFYSASAGSVTMRKAGPACVAGNEAACPLVILMGPEGEQNALDIISTMVFDDAGKVVKMRAYWSYDAMRKATDAD